MRSTSKQGHYYLVAVSFFLQIRDLYNWKLIICYVDLLNPKQGWVAFTFRGKIKLRTRLLVRMENANPNLYKIEQFLIQKIS